MKTTIARLIIPIAIVLVMLAVFWMILQQPAGGQERKYGVPTLAQEIDCLLVVYRVDEPDMARIEELALRARVAIGCKRTVVYSEAYVPILVPKDKVGAVKELLGDEHVLQISPKLK
jgi:hypothetical protein